MANNENINQQNEIDSEKLQRWLESVEGIAVDGFMIVRGESINGEPTWKLVEAGKD
jgi:hypothetical protein